MCPGFIYLEDLMSPLHCPLCCSSTVGFFHQDNLREYWRCGRCALVFVLEQYYLSAAAEKAQYDLHENIEGDPGYEAFLNRLAEPLLSRLEGSRSILDFGCGPAPVLANVLRRHGHSVTLYDYFYYRDEGIWSHFYDAITATEVFEHLHNPGVELERLWQHIREGGYLAVMTKRVIDLAAFSRWHYKNDPTHVCFFSADTFCWWAAQKNAHLEFIGADVVLLKK